MVPEKREEILARADDFAYSRQICGVHYPSDLAASRVEAYALTGLLLNNAEFQSELRAATTELRNALRVPVTAQSK